MLVVVAGVIAWLLVPMLRRALRFFGWWGFAPKKGKSAVVRFGVLGVARITPRALVWPCAWNTQADIVCVAARDPIRAKQFASKHEIPNVAKTYDEVLLSGNDQVNAVYIPLPNGLHFEWTKRALLAGKHCLVEKPLCSNAQQARELMQLAKQNNLVLMEASHSFYHPALEKMRNLLPQRVGKISKIEAKFHSRIPTSDIRFNCNGAQPELKGGSLMDNGVYAINAIRYVCWPTLKLSATCPYAQSVQRLGVDESMQAVLEFENTTNSPLAHISCSFAASSSNPFDRISTLRVTGEFGVLTMYNFLMPNLWHCIVSNQLQVDQFYGRDNTKTTTYEYQLGEFIHRVCTNNRQDENDPIDPVRTMEIIDAIYLQAWKGKL